MSEILDDLRISSLKINGGVNFGGRFVGSTQAGLVGGDSHCTSTAVLTTTLLTTLYLVNGEKHISLAAGTVGQMKIITATQKDCGESEIKLHVSNFVGECEELEFEHLSDSITLIYTAEGWVIVNKNMR